MAQDICSITGTHSERDSLSLLAGTSLAMSKCAPLAGTCVSSETVFRIKPGSAEKIFPPKMM